MRSSALDQHLLAPAQHRHASEFGAVIRDALPAAARAMTEGPRGRARPQVFWKVKRKPRKRCENAVVEIRSSNCVLDAPASSSEASLNRAALRFSVRLSREKKFALPLTKRSLGPERRSVPSVEELATRMSEPLRLRDQVKAEMRYLEKISKTAARGLKNVAVNLRRSWSNSRLIFWSVSELGGPIDV